jgi:hypothetical protein
MKLYGLKGFTHGWARVLTVMSAQGASGALDRLIESHGIIVLAKPDWDARKKQLGETIYR